MSKVESWRDFSAELKAHNRLQDPLTQLCITDLLRVEGLAVEIIKIPGKGETLDHLVSKWKIPKLPMVGEEHELPNTLVFELPAHVILEN